MPWWEPWCSRRGRRGTRGSTERREEEEVVVVVLVLLCDELLARQPIEHIQCEIFVCFSARLYKCLYLLKHCVGSELRWRVMLVRRCRAGVGCGVILVDASLLLSACSLIAGVELSFFFR